jgi:glycosyltransferase involved in cell wall biosynthesis
LKEIAELSLIGIGCNPLNETDRALIENEFALESFVTLNHRGPVSWGHRLKAASLPSYLPILPYAASASDLAQIAQVVRSADVVWLCELYTSYWLPQWHWPKSVMDLHDVPSTYHRSVSCSARGILNRMRASLRARIWQRREERMSERFSVLAVCSEQDKTYLNARMPVHVIPNGAERRTHESTPKRVQPPRLGFIGPLSFAPNKDGVDWFVRNCWPKIQQMVPGVRLRLVGRETNDSTRPVAPGIDRLGWIEDATKEIGTWSLMIAPIRMGAGTRLKVAEAFGQKCPLVSTRLGAFGYDVKHERELLLADRPRDFTDACVRLLQRPEEGVAMAERAWARFAGEWSWNAIAPKVWAAAEDALRGSGAKSGAP